MEVSTGTSSSSGLALDGEQDHVRAAARSALERPAIERRPVLSKALKQFEGYSAAVPFGQMAIIAVHCAPGGGLK